MLGLQRSAGNARTQQILRLVDGIEPEAAEDTRSEAEIVKDAIDRKSVPDAKHVKLIRSRYAGVSVADKLTLIGLLTRQFWVGPLDETALEKLWDSFGKDLPTALAQPEAGLLFDEGIQAGARLQDLPAFQEIVKQFEHDVVFNVHAYLGANERYVQEEMKALGIGVEDGGGAEAGRQAQERQAQVTFWARVAKKALEAKEKIEHTPVGRKHVVRYQATGEGPRERVDEYPEVNFDPAAKPEIPPTAEELSSGEMQDYDAVSNEYRKTMALLGGAQSASAAVYAAIDQGEVDELADPSNSHAAAEKVLTQTLANIANTREKLGSGDLDWRELKPIHDQLFRGQGVAKLDWGAEPNHAIAKGLVADYEDIAFWETLGIGTLAAAAFIFSEIATAGLASFAWAALGVGIGGIQAARSWERYDTLKTASHTEVSPDLELIAKGQATEALVTAILDTVFVALDVWGLGKAAGRAATGMAAAALIEKGAESAGAGALKELGRLSGAEARQALETGVRGMGIEETVKLTGKTPAELAELAGRDSELGAKLLAYDEALLKGGAGKLRGAAADELATVAKRIEAGGVARAEAEKALGEAIDRYGTGRTLEMAGGYDNVIKALGNESPLAKKVMVWRDGIEADLKQFMGEEAVQATGRRGLPSNDADMSFLGENAVANKERAQSWLAGKLGTTPEQVEKVIGGSLFIDPRRMHLYDLLPEAARTAVERRTQSVQLEMILNLERTEAQAAHNLGRVKELEDTLSSLGMKAYDVHKLSGSERIVLAQEIDKLHAQLAKALQEGKPADDLVEAISHRQALLNAGDPEAYVGAGTIKKYVTARDKIGGYSDETVKLSEGERLTDLADQRVKINRALEHLGHGPQNAADVIPTLKKIGKYGSREGSSAAEVLKVAEELAGIQRWAEQNMGKQVAEAETAEVVKRALTACETLHKDLEANLAKLARGAGLEGAGAEEIQQQIVFSLQLQRTIEQTRDLLRTAGRVIAQGTDPGFRDDGSGDDAEPIGAAATAGER